MTDDLRCSCNHLASQHTRGDACAECRCPAWTDSWEPVEANINEKWTLRLPPYRAYRQSWAWHEAARLAAMHERIQPGDVVYEIGAEEGDYGALFCSWGARVVLAEPNPFAWPSIRASFEANGYLPICWWMGLVAAHEWKIEDDPEPTRFATSGWPLASEQPLIPEHGFQHIAEHTSVTPGTSMERLAAVALHAPRVVSIDVEGAELHVLRGFRNVWDYRPDVFISIHPQFMHDLYDEDSADVHELMADHGYESTFLATDHEEHWRFVHRQGRAL